MNNKITEKKIVGAKQTLKTVKSGLVQRVYVADDAESKITKPVVDACKLYGVEVIHVETMEKLGLMCSIDVGAAVACTVKNLV